MRPKKIPIYFTLFALITLYYVLSPNNSLSQSNNLETIPKESILNSDQQLKDSMSSLIKSIENKDIKEIERITKNLLNEHDSSSDVKREISLKSSSVNSNKAKITKNIKVTMQPDSYTRDSQFGIYLKVKKIKKEFNTPSYASIDLEIKRLITNDQRIQHLTASKRVYEGNVFNLFDVSMDRYKLKIEKIYENNQTLVFSVEENSRDF